MTSSLSLMIARRFAHSLRRDGFARFTSIVSIASVALGCAALVLAMSILAGYEDVIRSTALRFAAPVEVRALSSTMLADANAMRTMIRTIPGVASAEGKISREALGRTRTGVDGILLLGMSASSATNVIAPMITQGGIPHRQTDTVPQCVVGTEVSRRLGLGIGDTLVIYTAEQSSHIRPILATAIVSGIARSGMQQYDETAVFLHDNALRKLLRVGQNDATSIAITPAPDANLDDIARHISQMLGNGVLVQTYKQKFNAIDAWIALQKEPIPIILGLISIVALFTVVATLLIAVVEKTRQIGILRTLGMTPRSVAWIFVWQGARIGTLGCAIGCATAFAFCLAQQTWQFIRLDGAIYYVSALPVSIEAFPYILVASTSICTSLIASIAPVFVASKIDLVRTVQFR